MYVSMNPKGETGKVIHISQNDTNRDIEFIPFDQNGLTPLTDGQLTARINSIKGNTVSFNQLVRPATGNAQTTNGITFTPNGDGSITVSGSASGGNAIFYCPTSVLIANHKYYGRGCPSGGNTNTYSISFRDNSASVVLGNDEGSGVLFTPTQNYSASSTLIRIVSGTSFSGAVKFYPQIFDLTLMGIDNLTTVAEVEQWLSTHIGDLPYFDYTQGILIPFMGTGLKTTGKNLLNDTYNGGDFDFYLPKGTYYYRRFLLTSKYDINSRLQVEINGTYVTVSDNSSLDDGQLIVVGSMGWDVDAKETITLSKGYKFRLMGSVINAIVLSGYAHLMLCGETMPTAYEPYTESTLSLPTLTYFPTGMKDCSVTYEVVDEMNLTIGKGHERVGSVDLGSLDWGYVPSQLRFYALLSSIKSGSQDMICSAYPYGGYKSDSQMPSADDKTLYNQSGSQYLKIKDTAYTDAIAFKQMLTDQNVKLYFELATPTEFDISLDLTYPVWNGGTEQIIPVNGSTPSTAPIKANITYPDRTEDTEFLYKQTSFEWIYKSWAFVCKNITQALSVVGNALKGTIPGTMTSESGKFPLKLKMTDDDDGVCFSEKIDLFVERKP